jgi:hypothetical protein
VKRLAASVVAQVGPSASRRIAIDKAGHGRRAVAGAEPDAERAVVVLEVRFAAAVPDDDVPVSLVRRADLRDARPDAGLVGAVIMPGVPRRAA